MTSAIVFGSLSLQMLRRINRFAADMQTALHLLVNFLDIIFIVLYCLFCFFECCLFIVINYIGLC
jgi:hypothetical protein